MNNNIPSDAKINGFAAGFKVADATLEVASKATAGTRDAARTTTHTVTGFFGGMFYAVRARRGEASPKVRVDDAAKRRAREELYDRAHRSESRALVIHEG